VPELIGDHYRAVDARAIPGCVQQPRVPFAIAATGPRGMGVVALHADTWVTFGHPVNPGELTADECAAEVRSQASRLDEACVAVGRDPTDVARLYLEGSTKEPWLTSIEAFRHLYGRYQELGFTDVALHWPPTAPAGPGPLTVLEAVAAEFTNER
jgi:hypothetical protein